jgi:four helix bundle protein
MVRRKGEYEMSLRVYDEMIEMVAVVSRLARKVEMHDPDLARQMRKSSTSVPLNFCEGMYSRGRNREARLHNSMGSAKETYAELDVSAAAEYLTREEVVDELKRLDGIVAVLYTLIHRPKRPRR